LLLAVLPELKNGALITAKSLGESLSQALDDEEPYQCDFEDPVRLALKSLSGMDVREFNWFVESANRVGRMEVLGLGESGAPKTLALCDPVLIADLLVRLEATRRPLATSEGGLARGHLMFQSSFGAHGKDIGAALAWYVGMLRSTERKKAPPSDTSGQTARRGDIGTPFRLNENAKRRSTGAARTAWHFANCVCTKEEVGAANYRAGKVGMAYCRCGNPFSGVNGRCK
jgi:hypothetical protein